MSSTSAGRRIRSLFTTALKLAITILAFYLLLNHKVTDEGRLNLLLPQGVKQSIPVGEELHLARGIAEVTSSRELLVDGEPHRLKPGQHLQLADGTDVQVLSEGKTTTFQAIKAYLPKIEAQQFWTFVLIAAFVKAIGIVASMLRWHTLLIGQRIRFPFSHLAGTFLIGRFLGTFLPSTVGLDGYTLYDAARYSKKTVEVAAAKLIEKVMGIIGILLTFLVTLPLGYAVFANNLGTNAAKVTLVTVTISVGAIGAFFLLMMRPKLVDPLLRIIPGEGKPVQLLRRIRNAAGAYEAHKGLLVVVAFYSFLVHFLTAIMYYFTALAIGAGGANIWEVSFASSIQIFATVISPFTIAGEGVREIVTYVLLGRMMGGEATILFSALGFWAAEALTLAGGVIWLARRRGYSPRFVLVEGAQVDVDEAEKSEAVAAEKPLSRGFSWKRISSSTLGGLFGGALLGFLEALLILKLANLEEIWVFPYAFLTYGIVGAVLGGAIGLVVQPIAHVAGRTEVRGTTFALAFAGVFSVWGAVITRFRLIRDLFRERPPQGMVLPLVILAAAAIVGLLLFVVVRRLSRRGGPLAVLRDVVSGPLIYAGLFGIMVLLAWWGRARIPESYEGGISVQTEISDKPNVILLIVDTMRADRLGCYGYAKQTSPVLDRFAEESILFEQAVVQASWTRPSIATILSGLYPSTHRAISKVSVMPDEVPTLAEAFRDAGYRTAGFANNINIAPMFGFGQGFTEYHHLKPSYFFKATESAAKLSLYDILRMVRERFISKSKFVDHYYRDAEYVTEKATRWLRENKRSGPFFLFLHYMDPHDPFFIHPYNGKGYARVSMPHPPLEMAHELSDTYDGEITFWDHSFSELVEFLREDDLLDESIVVVTADHGEEFAEHGGWWHGTTLYEEQILVPLIIRLPDASQGGLRVNHQVRLLDLAPTLLDRCGIPVPGTMQGLSLRWENPEFAGIEYIYAEEDLEGCLLEAVRTETWKLVKANQGNRRNLEPLELYDLASDPLERRSIVDLEQKEVKRLQGVIDDIGREAVDAAVEEQTRELDAETRDQLRALGYME
jgi:arylsulfatase A-like enzyme/uncharacterized membrane protein YbhN (UPF0104 family)